jgi:anaerobic magnesium-protoporphyrin IX monomethyl ester cyclase
MRKVILIEPDKLTSGRPMPPVPLLYLGAAIQHRDDVAWEIVDYNAGQTVQRFLHDPAVVLFGITARTGDSLVSASRVAREIKAACPDVPVVWGGPHVTSVPEEAIEEPFVDIVVVGDAEETLNELLTALIANRPLDGVNGILFRRDGRVVRTPKRAPVDLSRTPLLPYERLNLADYDTSLLWLNTSRGCPYRCEFCVNAVAPSGRYRGAMPAGQVVDHLRHYLGILKPQLVFFTDYNFFVDLERVREIAKRIIAERLTISWAGHVVAGDVARLAAEDLDLLRRSGCVSLVSGQDGSARLMEQVRKPSTHEQVEKALERLSSAGIEIIVNYIIGLPEETSDDLESVLRDIRTRGERFHQPLNVYVFFPWPGTPIVERIRNTPYSVQRGMEQWSDVFLGDARPLRFLSARHRRRVQTIYYVVALLHDKPLAVFAPPTTGPLREARTRALGLLRKALRAAAERRWRRNTFDWGVEIALLHSLAIVRHRYERRRLARSAA